MIEFLRRLRHGSPKRFDAVWRPLGRGLRWILVHADGRIAVRQRIGSFGPFRMDALFAFSDFANWGQRHNEGFAACVESCRGRLCAIDVGAHIGLVTLSMASVLAPRGVVIAFEPAEINRKMLQRHVTLNSLGERVRVEGALVGADERPSVGFFELGEPAGMNTTVEGVLSGDVRHSYLPQTSLDAYCRRTGTVPEVVKIDVEGAEIGVLEGAREVLTEHQPIVFLSVHPRQIQASGRTLDDLAGVIASVGYECRHIDGSPISKFALREYVLAPRQIACASSP